MTEPAASGSAITVHVDLISWVNQFVGGPGTGATEFSEQVQPGATARTVLNPLSSRHINSYNSWHFSP
ncbi:MAG: hypothetical protein IIA41_13125 [SAR324 cluster bacterium]|nr:hypothetical protein [SAR324 cluster bacterium]